MAKGGDNTAYKTMQLAAPIAQELGLTIWDIRYVKEGGNYFLRVMIDKPGSVSITDCENMSRALDKKLDEENFIDGAYILEVASAGLERDLTRPEHFQYATGKNVCLRLIHAQDKRRDYEGTLQDYNREEKTVVVLTDSGEKIFSIPQLSFIKYVWQQTNEPAVPDTVEEDNE